MLSQFNTPLWQQLHEKANMTHRMRESLTAPIASIPNEGGVHVSTPFSTPMLTPCRMFLLHVDASSILAQYYATLYNTTMLILGERYCL